MAEFAKYIRLGMGWLVTPTEFLKIITKQELETLRRFKDTDFFLTYWRRLVKKYGPKELKNTR